MIYSTKNRVLVVASLIPLAWMFSTIPTEAHSPVEFLQVYHVTPSNEVDHHVELQSVLDTERVETRLLGPQRLAEAVGCLGRQAKTQAVYLNWYRIAGSAPSPERSVKVIDLLSGENDNEIKIGNAEFLLSPSQRITSGPPDPIPDGLDQLVAYRVIEPVATQIEIELQTSKGKQIRRVGEPVYCCLSTKQWHHKKHIESTHPRDCFVVYRMDALADELMFSTIDQFGLNRLKASESDLLCVLGSLVSDFPSNASHRQDPSDPPQSPPPQ